MEDNRKRRISVSPIQIFHNRIARGAVEFGEHTQVAMSVQWRLCAHQGDKEIALGIEPDYAIDAGTSE